jgi:hypothetical protein
VTVSWSPDDPRWEDDAATVPYGPPTPIASLRRPEPPGRWRTRGRAACAALGVVAGIVVVAALAQVLAPEGTRAPVDLGGAVAMRAGCRPGPPPSPSVQLVVVDADRCTLVRYHRRTGVLVRDDRRYLVGAPGDWLLVGDWDCDGTTTPALYRPSSGAVLTFDEWADDGAVSSAAPSDSGTVGGVPSVVGDEGCDRVDVAPHPRRPDPERATP